MLDIIPYVMEEVWGLSDNKIAIGDTVRLRLDEVMNFTYDLLEDIQQREAGRNQLLSSMDQLTQRMKESSVDLQTPFARMEPQFLRTN
ncbi:hypothetical protein D3C74_114400 [compost metagenome]